MTARRVVAVVGGSRGLGAATAGRFVRAGFPVATLSRSDGTVEGALSVPCDVTDTASVDAAFTEVERRLGPAAVVAYCAGVTDDALLARTSDKSFDRLVDVNLTGVYRVVRRAAGRMTRDGWGRVVLVSSVAALSGAPGQSGYGAAKAGLIGLARSLARELGPGGTTVNVVAPGFVETAMTAGVPAPVREHVLSTTPLARFGRPEEVAALIAFLAGDDAGYITGAVIPVDGGQGMGW